VKKTTENNKQICGFYYEMHFPYRIPHNIYYIFLIEIEIIHGKQFVWHFNTGNNILVALYFSLLPCLDEKLFIQQETKISMHLARILEREVI
jgi:hypothetical protein